MQLQNPLSVKDAKVLVLAVEELRRLYDNIGHIFDQVRAKALALIAGEVAILTFIFTSSYPFPKDYYVGVFFYTGAGSLVFAFGVLLWIVSPMKWKFTHGFISAHQLAKKYQTETDFLEYLNDDYIEAINHNHPLVEARAKRINWAIYALVAGVTIILIVKFGG